MKKIFYILFLGLLVISCSDKKQPRANSQGQRVGLGMQPRANSQRLAVTPTLDCLPLFIAENREWFKRDGLDLSLKMFTAHMDVDTALVGGSLIGGFTETIRLAELQKRHPNIKFDPVTKTNLHWSLVTNRMARLNRLDQFAEKMVAMTRYSATDHLTDETVGKEKLKSGFFKVQINDVKVRLKMILCNEMDAAWLPEPQASWAEHEGHKCLLDENKLNHGQCYGVLIINQRFKSMEPAILKLYKEAEDSIKKYGQEHYNGIIEKYCR